MATDAERNRGAGAYSGAGVETQKPETGPSQIITQKPILAFRTTQVDPPSPFYVTEVDALVVEIHNSQLNADVAITWRLLDIYSGELKQNIQDVFPTSDRIINVFRFSLSQGFLLSVQIGYRGAGGFRGQTFVKATLERGNVPAQFGTATLFYDYIAKTSSPGWPSGRQSSQTEGPGWLHNVPTTNPAAGAELVITVTAGARWRVISALFTLTTSVTVANRNVEFLIDDGVNAFWRVSAPITVPASTTQSFNLASFNVPQALIATDSVLPMPAAMLLPPGYRLRTLTGNIQVGDQYANSFTLVEEWLDF